MPRVVGRWLSRMVDVLRILFFATAAVLTVQLMIKLVDTRMTVVDLPMNLVYGVCLLGFVGMFGRSIWVMRIHLQRQYSMLERPETSMEDRA
jgi:TRAP-type transport system small permease protein